MVKKIDHRQLAELTGHYYNTKEPLFIWGTFGIGKSRVIQDVAKDLASGKSKEFVNWNKSTGEKKQEVFNNPEKYFTLIDIRLSEYDSSDIKGLPNFMDDKKAIEFKVPFWALLLEKPQSDGILFFDEINLATPLVISSCYKIIYDRVINDGKINDNWLIVGCGNKSEDRAYTHDIAPPLRDRGGEVELIIPSVDTWTDWAVKNGIDHRIIGFVNFKSSALWRVDFNDEQKFTTNRGWERVSKLIKGMPTKDKDKLDLVCGSAIGEGVATEFVAYCSIQDKINLDELIKNPEGLKNVQDIGIKFFVTTAVADKYKDKKVVFDKVMDISKALDACNNAEMVAYLWKLCSGYNKKFKEEFVKKIDTKLSDKYCRYIVA